MSKTVKFIFIFLSVAISISLFFNIFQSLYIKNNSLTEAFGISGGCIDEDTAEYEEGTNLSI